MSCIVRTYWHLFQVMPRDVLNRWSDPRIIWTHPYNDNPHTLSVPYCFHFAVRYIQCVWIVVTGVGPDYTWIGSAIKHVPWHHLEEMSVGANDTWHCETFIILVKNVTASIKSRIHARILCTRHYDEYKNSSLIPFFNWTILIWQI